ncbi:MAG: hypothetical protein WA647_19065 [Candidatus Acidiferrum sp.]
MSRKKQDRRELDEVITVSRASVIEREGRPLVDAISRFGELCDKHRLKLPVDVKIINGDGEWFMHMTLKESDGPGLLSDVFEERIAEKAGIMPTFMVAEDSNGKTVRLRFQWEGETIQ